MAPWRVNDGNFSIPLIVKDGYRFPFSEKGDGVSFEYVLRQRFDKSRVVRSRAMDPIQTTLGTAYLVGIGDLDDTGDGIFEQELVYASVPASRVESGGMVFAQQIRSGFTATTMHYKTSVEVDFDYGIGILPKLIAPRYYLDGVTLLYRGDKPPPTFGKIIAEDSEVTLYKGNIYQRRTPYINYEQLKKTA